MLPIVGVIAIDRDPSAIAGAQSLCAEFPGRLTVSEAPFSELDAIIEEQGCDRVDGVVLDIGVSSMQLDQPERGFSFQTDGPLDMRMSARAETAADFVNAIGRGEARTHHLRLGRRASLARNRACHRQAPEPCPH